VGDVVGERRAGTGERPTAETDQTRALAAGTGGSNRETSVAARQACISGGREWGRVKGTDGEPASEPGPVDGDYTGTF